ncbi:MAG TPA: hypothetical protein VJN22_06080 [Candidatus Eremiobacteraceae bacterium]|nr:hypothetical protein [Candidatus Eremiobacteraceae bacterium]
MILALAVAASVVATVPRPLREVVYHVSYARRTASTGSTGVTDHGTVTVDVMAVSNNALGLKVTERWAKNPTALVTLGTVQPTGKLTFAPGVLSDISYQLLPYFAPQFVPQRPLLQGVAWSLKDDHKDLAANTAFAVTAVQGSSVTISVKQTVSIRDATHAQISTNGNVVYEPRLLVPLSGDFTKHLSMKVGGAKQSVSLTLNFARASDTRDPG